MPTYLLLFVFFNGLAFAAECPKNGEDWSKWRKVAVTEAKTLNDLSEAGLFIQKCESDPETAGPLADFLLGACLEPLKHFGLAYNDNDRRGENTRPTMEYSPEEKALLGGIPLVRGVHRSQGAVAAPKKEPSALAIQRLITAFPGSYALKRNDDFIVVLPGEKFDRWYSFTPFGVTQLDIVKKDEEGKPRPKPVAVFTDNPLAEEGPLEDVATCTKCHMTGAVALLKETDTKGKFSEVFTKQNIAATLAAMNKLAKRTSHAIPSSVNVSDYGPLFGPAATAGRTPAFLASCTKIPKISKETLTRIKNGMNCASCHNGNQSAALNVPIGIEERVSRGVMEEGHSPAGNALSVKERGMVRDCLLQEYYGKLQGAENVGLLQSWLLVPSCPAKEIKAN